MKHSIIIALLFIIPLSNFAQNSPWNCYTWQYPEGTTDMNARFCEVVQNGQMRIAPSMLNNMNDYFSRLNFLQSICTGENFTFEIRLRNSRTIGGVRAYDVNVLLNTPNGETGCVLMGESWATSFTKVVSDGNTVLQNSSKLVMDLTSWSVLKIQLKNKVLTYYKDNISFFSAPYTSKICNINGFQVVFKGGGAIDWIRVTNDDENKTTYFEDFLNCNQPQLPVACTPSVATVVANSPCEGDTLKLSTPTRAVAYEWRGPNGFISNNSVVAIPKTNNSHGGTYFLKTQITNCQTGEGSANVVINALPIIPFGKDTVICPDKTLLLDAGVQGKTYLWQNGATSRYFTVKNEGKYTVNVTSAEGCKSSASINVAASPSTIKFTTDVKPPKCFGDCNGEIRVSASGGFGAPFTYKWTSSKLDTYRIALCAGDYSLTIVDAKGCEVSTVITLQQPQKITAEALPINQFNGFAISCADRMDGQIRAKGSGGAGNFTYEWNTVPVQNTQVATNLRSGTYQVTVFDKNGCSATASATITAPPQLSADFLSENIKCFGEKNGAVFIKNTNGGVQPYQYSFNQEGFDTLSKAENMGSGNYKIQVKDANNCLIQKEITIVEPPKMRINTTTDTTIFLGDKINLYAGVETPSVLKSVSWTSNRDSVRLDCTDCSEAVAVPYLPTIFKVAVTDTFGCKIEKQIVVQINKRRRVYVPTAFSPNDDRNNDIFKIYAGNDVKRILKFHIFNRWGNLVFAESNFLPKDENKGWDGKYNGSTLPNDAYIWFAEIEFEDGETAVYRGDVTLIR